LTFQGYITSRGLSAVQRDNFFTRTFVLQSADQSLLCEVEQAKATLPASVLSQPLFTKCAFNTISSFQHTWYTLSLKYRVCISHSGEQRCLFETASEECLCEFWSYNYALQNLKK